MKFKTNWALVECINNVVVAYLGHGKNWCLSNCYSWNNGVILQNVSASLEDRIFSISGTRRNTINFFGCEKYKCLSLLDKLEIKPDQYIIKNTLFFKKPYFKVEPGYYLYRKPGPKTEIISPNFRIVK